MTIQQKKSKVRCTRRVLRIPDLEQSKHTVLNSLLAGTSQESYGHAIDEFISWYCSEPRLAFNHSVSGRTMGNRRPHWKGPTHQDGANAQLG